MNWLKKQAVALVKLAAQYFDLRIMEGDGPEVKDRVAESVRDFMDKLDLVAAYVGGKSIKDVMQAGKEKAFMERDASAQRIKEAKARRLEISMKLDAELEKIRATYASKLDEQEGENAMATRQGTVDELAL